MTFCVFSASLGGGVRREHCDAAGARPSRGAPRLLHPRARPRRVRGARGRGLDPRGRRRTQPRGGGLDPRGRRRTQPRGGGFDPQGRRRTQPRGGGLDPQGRRRTQPRAGDPDPRGRRRTQPRGGDLDPRGRRRTQPRGSGADRERCAGAWAAVPRTSRPRASGSQEAETLRHTRRGWTQEHLICT